MILSKISDNSRQELTLVLSNGEEITIELFYSIRGLAWYLTLSYKEKKICNLKLTSSINNILYQYDKTMPIKIKVGTNTGFSPLFITDFINNNNYIDIEEITKNL